MSRRYSNQIDAFSVTKPAIEDYATVESMSNGVPVYSFNHLIYVYGESPDFFPGINMQENNCNPVSKIKPKKTWEIKNNFAGVCHEMAPRTRWNDSQPYLPIHLIDGDPGTIWASFECHVPDGRQEWIRIDLPMESLVSSISLTCLKNYMDREEGFTFRPQWNFGKALPKDMAVKLSRDAWHWDTVFECKDMPVYSTLEKFGSNSDYKIKAEDSLADGYIIGDLENPDGITVILKEPILAKQIWITANDFSKNGYEGYMFSISGVEVRDPAGNNLALVSRGAGVTVSSTSDADNSDRYSANSLWGPLQYDMGNKWTKMGSDNGPSMWYFTEHVKGMLKVDEEFDQAITEAVNNGMKVMMTLDFKGNWIYENPPRKTNWFESRFREINETYICGVSLVDDSPEMFEGYLRYVAYMVEHFKDRVEYFEIGNEWNVMSDSINWYKNTIFEPTYDVIKKTAPDAKISLCSTAGFLPEDILCCLGPGVSANCGKLIVPGRILATVKRMEEKDFTINVIVKSEDQAGFVLGVKKTNSFLLPSRFLFAIYDSQKEQMYFLESKFNGDGNFILKGNRIATVPVKGMEYEVHLEAGFEGKTVTFSVSDGKQSFSTTYTFEHTDLEVSAGLFHYSRQLTGEFHNFSISDNSGNIIFEEDFNNTETLAERWDLLLNHWDNKKPNAALRIDAIGWHPGGFPDKTYFDEVRELRSECEKLGFQGEYFCNEIYAGSVYPPGPQESHGIFQTTDIQEAKYFLRSMVGHNSLNIEAGPCHMHFTGFPHPQALCRTTWPSQAAVPCQPKPSYYCIRNIATAMDDFYESEFPVDFSEGNDIICFTLESGDKSQLMIAAWLQAPLSDSITEKKSDILLPGKKISKAWVIDTFNGTEQELDVLTLGKDTILKGLLIKDYPVLLRIQKNLRDDRIDIKL